MNIRRRLVLFVTTNLVVYLSLILLAALFSGGVLFLRRPSNSVTSHQLSIVDWRVMLLKTSHVMVVNQPSKTSQNKQVLMKIFECTN